MPPDLLFQSSQPENPIQTKKHNYTVIHPTLHLVKKDSKMANQNIDRKDIHTAKQ